MAQCDGRRFVAQVTPPTSFNAVPAGRRRLRKLAPALGSMVLGKLALALRAQRKAVRTETVWGGSLINNEVGPLIYDEILPRTLAADTYKGWPEPVVVGHGLGCIPAALKRRRLGVSASKLVVAFRKTMAASHLA